MADGLINREGWTFRPEYTLAADFLRIRYQDETLVLLSKLNVDKHIDVEIKLDELDLTSAESKATYVQIKEYILEKFNSNTLYCTDLKEVWNCTKGTL